MTEAQHTNDNPIRTPVEDALGIDPFAQVIAHSIRTMQAPEGFVIAINGPWGSGKSSAVNLVTHHLSDARTNGDFDILSFSCWWFRGEEALAISFFNELTAVIGDSIEEAQNILPKLRDKMIQTGPLLQALADSAAPGSGHLMKAITQMLQKSESENETVEQLHDQLRDALARSDKRILVVIDDIDRLSPEEAIQMFRLIKSVGHLPNVIYLLAYDRELAERVVHERFPSEGPHYLEKIVQNVFELPNPRIPDLHSLLLQNVERICQPDISEEAVVHFLNIFHEVVAPEIRTPRDVVRLTNAISVTWSAIAGEVNLGDFVGVEAMRVFQPELYRAIRANKQQLCELPSMSAHRNVEQEAKDADRVLLYGVRESDHLHYRKVIERLFPAMQSVWGNMLYTPEWKENWARWRRVGSERHFETYFRFSVSDDTLPAKFVDIVIENADDLEFIKRSFRQALKTKRRDGSTNASLLLEELDVHAKDFPEEKSEPFLTALFSLGDELDVPEDRPRGLLSLAGNRLRMHWLIRGLTLDRFSLEQRSAIFYRACEHAALGWLVNFATSAYNDHYPNSESAEQVSEDRCLVDRSTLDSLLDITLLRLRAAANDGSLQEHPDLAPALFAWRDFANDDGREVQQATANIMADDHGVACLARAFTTDVWMHASGDMVDRRKKRANTKNLSSVLDTREFRRRLEELEAQSDISDKDREAACEFLLDWRRQDEGRDDF